MSASVLTFAVVLAFVSAALPSPAQLRASMNSPAATRPAEPPLTAELRGDIYMARKMYRDAIDMYRTCDVNARVENKIGIAFHQMSQLGLAKKHYEQAVKLDRSYAEAVNNLGTVYYMTHSFRRATTYFHRSLKISGPVASVYVNLGSAYFARHQYEEASKYFEEAMKLDPDVLEHHNGFGTRIQDREIEDLALFHLYLAKTYARAGSDERALTYLRKALEEGLKDRKKLPDVPEFSALRLKPGFLELMTENPKPL